MSDSRKREEFLEACEKAHLGEDEFAKLLKKNQKHAADNNNQALGLAVENGNWKIVEELMKISQVKDNSHNTQIFRTALEAECKTGFNAKNINELVNLPDAKNTERLNYVIQEFKKYIAELSENPEADNLKIALLKGLGSQKNANNHELLRYSIEKKVKSLSTEFIDAQDFEKSFKGQQGEISSEALLLVALKADSQDIAIKLLEKEPIAKVAVTSQPVQNFIGGKEDKFKDFNDKLNVKRDEEFKKNKENKPVVLFMGSGLQNNKDNRKIMPKDLEANSVKKNTIARKP